MPNISYIHILIVLGFIVVAIGIGLTVYKLIQPPEAPESTAFEQYRIVVRKFLVVGFGIPIFVIAATVVVSFIETDQLNNGGSADGWGVLRTVLGIIGNCGLAIFPLVALIASEQVVRRLSVPIATLAPRSVTTLVAAPVLAVACIIGIVALVTTVGALLIDHSSTDLDFGRNLTQDWVALSLLAITSVLTIVAVRLAVSRGDLDATDSSDAWTRSGVATRAIALFVVGASIAWFLAADTFSNAAWAYEDAGESAPQGWQWLESAHILGLSQFLPIVPFLLIIVAFVMVAKPPVKAPHLSATAEHA